MGKALTKSERFLALEVLLLSHPAGLRKSEIAKRLGIDRSTAGRYVAELTDPLGLVEDDDGRIWIDKGRYLPPVRLFPACAGMNRFHGGALRIYAAVPRVGVWIETHGSDGIS